MALHPKGGTSPHSSAPQRRDLSPACRLLHPAFSLQVERMKSDKQVKAPSIMCLGVPLGQREGWGGRELPLWLLLSSWGRIPPCLPRSHEDRELPA